MSHVKVEFNSNWDTLIYFMVKNKSFFCIHGLKKYIEASDLIHILVYSVSWPLLIFVMGIFWPSGGQKLSEAGVSRAPSQWKFFHFLKHVFRYQLETLCIHLVGIATHRVIVSSQSVHFDLLYSQKWIKVFFFIYGLSNYIELSDLVHTRT